MKPTIGCHSLTGFRLVLLFLIVGATWMPLYASRAQAIAGQQPRTRVQGERVTRRQIAAHTAHMPQAEGVEIANKKAKLKPGYKFIRKSGNTVVVAKKKKGNGGTIPTMTVTCTCNSGSGNGSCSLSVNDGIATCSNGTCSACTFETVIMSPPTHHRH